MIKVVMQSLATLTLIGQVMVVGLIFMLVFQKRLKKNTGPLMKLLRNYGMYWVFVVSLIATLGSLFFSEIAKFQPCILCWYQRILMYPQVLVSYMAVLRKEFVVKPYLLALNGFGLVIALYHYFLQIQPKLLMSPCIAGDVSCIKGYTFYFGYITIPLMAATAFTMNILFLSFISYTKRHA